MRTSNFPLDKVVLIWVIIRLICDINLCGNNFKAFISFSMYYYAFTLPYQVLLFIYIKLILMVEHVH